jgi:integration host factor subunit beta
MVKSELVRKLCDIHSNILRKDIEKIIEIIIFEITEALCRNEAVEIRGFGRFKIVMRKARIGRNPKNSETVQIPAKKAIKWKMSKVLYNKLNKKFTENKISATN